VIDREGITGDIDDAAATPVGDVTAEGATPRPSKMVMAIQTGMLKTLGINLYTSIGKVLVEFIANAYDSDANKVAIRIPFDVIAEERQALRARLNEELADAAAKAESGQDTSWAADGGEDGEDEVEDPSLVKFRLLTQTLPEDILVTIEDDGHGMTTAEVQNKFLPLNRSRRKDKKGRERLLKTESGRRYVMGRKGLGKLAGFGAATVVQVWTKRVGDTHATVITMSDDALGKVDDVRAASIPVTYEDGLEPDLHGTRIEFRSLKSDALQDSEGAVRESIARSFFAVKPEDMRIELNGKLISVDVPAYEFIYPAELTRDDVVEDRLASGSAPVEGLGEIGFRYYVGFRSKNEHLPAGKRGARIYCNKRLAAGPTLLKLGTGMHSFHSQDYMEAVFEVDELDRGPVDIINTSRTQFKEGNEIFEALSDRLTDIMKAAIARHAKYREDQAEHELNNDPEARVLMRIVRNLPRKTRKAAEKLLKSIASVHPVGTEEFQELAPVILNSVNATEVLTKLITLGSKPETLGKVAGELRELAEIEKLDALKLYRGRRSGIQAIQTLMEGAQREDWRTKMREKELHQLLKDNPWLIRPEFSTYLTSDIDINKTVTRVAEALGVDEFAPIFSDVDEDPSKSKKDRTRPDLTFMLSDPVLSGPYRLMIVELKSPSMPLEIEHYRQLEDYIFKIKTWCKNNVTHYVSVHGYLIGSFPKKETTVGAEVQLLDKWQRSSPNDEIRIVDVMGLIQEAKQTHLEAIKALEQDTAEDDEADDVPAAASQAGDATTAALP
jgi:hypothetical protein